MTPLACQIVREANWWYRWWLINACVPDKNNRGSCVDALKEVWGKVEGTEWCAQFISVLINRALISAGVTPERAKTMFPSEQSTRIMLAKAAGLGIRIGNEPVVGAVFFRPRGEGKGHVGIVIEVDEQGGMVTIEGNASNSVRRETYKKSEIHNEYKFIRTDLLLGEAQPPRCASPIELFLQRPKNWQYMGIFTMTACGAAYWMYKKQSTKRRLQ